MRLASLVIIFLLGITNIVTAQDELPPTPSEIFIHDVEVLSVEPIIDYKSRRLYLYTENRWHSYAFPEAFLPVSDDSVLIMPRLDNTLLVIEEYDYHKFNFWLLEPEIGQFSQTERPCDIRDEDLGWTTLYDRENLLRGGWVYYIENELTYLCSMTTGKVDNPLPSDGAWGFTGYSIVYPPHASPDGKWLILTQQTDIEPIYPFRIYSYEIQSNELRLMGEFGIFGGGPDQFEMGDWLNNTTFTIKADSMPEWSTRNVMVGDVTVANSLRIGARRWRFWPVIRGTTFEYLPADMEDGPYPGPCYADYSDIATGENHSYDMGDLCDKGIRINDGSGDFLYRGVYPDASLIRFNPQTGKRMTLFSGEIEYVGSTSPGGRYVTLGLGNNGYVDTDQDPDINFGIQVDPSVYLIFDLSEGRFIGEMRGRWFSESLLISGDNQLVRITDEGFIEQSLPGEIVLSLPDRGQLLLQNKDRSIAFYDVAAEINTPFLQSEYTYRVSLEQSDIFRVSVSRSPEDVPAVWRVRLR